MNTLKYIALTLISLLVLLSCKPAFETTAQKCETNQNESVFANFTTFEVKVDPEGNVVTADGNRIEVDANGNRVEVDANGNFVTSELNEYRLYLQDIFTAMKANSPILDDDPSTSPAISAADKVAAINSIVSRFNTLMPYTIENGVVTSADNPIDFIEYLITSTKDSEIIQSFVDAKRRIAEGIKSDDGFCLFTNRNINLNKVTLETNGNVKTKDQEIFAELRMTFDPFNYFFSQNIILTEKRADLEDTNKRTQTPFVGFYESEPSKVKAQGFSPPTVRFASMNNPDLTETFEVDDDFDSKLGQLIFTTFNSFCSEIDANGLVSIINCSSGPTHAITKDQCDGGLDVNVVAQTDEVGKMQRRTIDLVPGNSDLSGIQRFRLETDYATGEVRVYVSRYTEAILDADAIQEVGISNVIINPTACEKQAVLDELALISNIDANSDGVRLTVVPDLGYDITYELESNGDRKKDLNGDDIVIEPKPIFTFQGTDIAARK